MTTIEEYTAGFDEEPGYLDFARVGPVGRVIVEEQRAMTELLVRARFGTIDATERQQDERVRNAVSAVTGFAPHQIAFQPNTSQGLLHAMFGLTGTVAVAGSEFPSLPVAAVRANQALGALDVHWLQTDDGRVTPGTVREQLTPAITAVAVSLVDFRTGYLTDIDGIRQVIGDRLLIVDAIQGFGVVDAPYEVADVVASGGQKWARAGWGTGFLALSDRALDALTPVFSGITGTAIEGMFMDEVPPPARAARAFTVSNPDPLAEARFAVALEELADAGVGTLADAVRERAQRLIDAADEFGIPVASSRADHERAGIVVLAPPAEQLTALSASLHNAGISATIRAGSIRLSAHATTSDETVEMLRSALRSFAAPNV
jgi:selenocysteine lyase/cysteine desulfurase